MKTKTTIRMFLALSALAVALPNPARADRDDHDRGWDRGHFGWRDHDIRRFRGRDFDTWRGGHWQHGWHDGRLGWWWIAAGLWYLYALPQYPYPNPYVPPNVVVVQPGQPAAPPAPPPAAPPAAQYWYYCDSAKAYYPYVPSCPTGWRMVPVQPPGAR